MLIVFLTIGTTDVMFAFDSIPAIFGLTKDPFIVFTSNVFALLGLQQLYFLLGELLDKLVYLPLDFPWFWASSASSSSWRHCMATRCRSSMAASRFPGFRSAYMAVACRDRSCDWWCGFGKCY